MSKISKKDFTFTQEETELLAKIHGLLCKNTYLFNFAPALRKAFNHLFNRLNFKEIVWVDHQPLQCSVSTCICHKILASSVKYYNQVGELLQPSSQLQQKFQGPQYWVYCDSLSYQLKVTIGRKKKGEKKKKISRQV